MNYHEINKNKKKILINKHGEGKVQQVPRKRKNFCVSATLISCIACFVIIGIIAFYIYFEYFYKSNSNSNKTYDYIVIGSGPSGSIVASRLAFKGYSVLLLEAGNTTQYNLNGKLNVKSDTNLTIFDIPLDWNTIITNNSYAINYKYNPNGTITPTIGKGIGGSGAINAMIYIRGTQQDFTLTNGWIKEWNNYSYIMNYYMKWENNSNLFNNSYHSNDGQVHISYNKNYQNDTLYNKFINVCNKLNYSVINDFNTPNRPFNICGNYQFMIHNYNNHKSPTIRDSVANAFLGDTNKPKTLTILPNSFVVKILFKNNKTAHAVQYFDLNNKSDQHPNLITIYAKNEIILSAGALNTPTILMQSGIGDENILKNKFNFKNIILDNKYIGKHYIDGVHTHVIYNVSNELINNFTLCTPWNSTYPTDEAEIQYCNHQWDKYLNVNDNQFTTFDTTGFTGWKENFFLT